jgi:DNA-binding CsgD family transcriptional regulator
MSKRSLLSLTDIRGVFRLLNEMLDTKADHAMRRHHLVEGLCRLLSARQGSVLEFVEFSPNGNPRLVDFVGGGWASPEAAELWQEKMKSENWRGDAVLNEAVQMVGPSQAFRRCELVSDQEYYSGDSYHLIAKKAGVDDTMVAWFGREEPGRVSALAFQREILSLVVSELRVLYLAGKLDPPSNVLPPLPPRLSRLLRELLTGRGEKQIAASLGLSRLTVNDYAKDLYRRMKVESRAELMAKFINLGK